MLRPFRTDSGEQVVDFRAPRKHLQVRQRRLDGWPTIAGTRIGFDTIADLVRDGSVPFESVAEYYPDVSGPAARDALDFMESLPLHHEEPFAA